MTDEEKIDIPKDVYLRNIFCRDCSLKKTCGNDPCENYEYWKEGYEKGLTKGRKEKCEQLEKENAKLSKMIEMACDILGDFLVYDSYSVMVDWGITLENKITIRSVIENRVEN